MSFKFWRDVDPQVQPEQVADTDIQPSSRRHSVLGWRLQTNSVCMEIVEQNVGYLSAVVSFTRLFLHESH